MTPTSPEEDSAGDCLKNGNSAKSEDLRVKNVSEINGNANSNGAKEEDAPNGGAKRKLPSWMLTASSAPESPTQSKRAKPTSDENAVDTNVQSNEAIACVSNPEQNEAEVKDMQDLNQNEEPETNDEEGVKDMHDLNPNEPASSSADDNAVEDNSGTTVKIEPEDIDNDENNATTSTGAVGMRNCDIKPAVKIEKADASSTSRESCRFGIRCYRRNPMHRIEEAHPGDQDYKRPDYPPPPEGVPDCPYGNSCYRRNPTHFEQFKHPDNTDFAKNYRNYRLRQRKRQQQQQQNNSNDDEDLSDLDDYDLDDPFINDDSDSDYEPSEEEDYTEELDYDDCDKAEE